MLVPVVRTTGYLPETQTFRSFDGWFAKGLAEMHVLPSRLREAFFIVNPAGSQKRGEGGRGALRQLGSDPIADIPYAGVLPKDSTHPPCSPRRSAP
eukprot:353425-Chlamydomonas_euryale.AAC.4